MGLWLKNPTVNYDNLCVSICLQVGGMWTRQSEDDRQSHLVVVVVVEVVNDELLLDQHVVGEMSLQESLFVLTQVKRKVVFRIVRKTGLTDFVDVRKVVLFRTSLHRLRQFCPNGRIRTRPFRSGGVTLLLLPRRALRPGPVEDL